MRQIGKSLDGKYLTSPAGLEVPEIVQKLLDLLPPRNLHTLMADYSNVQVSRYHVIPFSLNYVTAEEINNAYKGIFNENFLRACKEMCEGVIDSSRSPHNILASKQEAKVVKGDNMASENVPNVEITIENVQYTSIEDYTTKTGKRFRMTKELKNLSLTREQAFAIMYQGKTLADFNK